MGADIIELSASSSNPETLLGNEERPGALLEAIAKAGMSRNLFIFIDELDKSVNQDKADAGSLLKLLEPCEKYFYSPFLGCKVDTSHCTFLSAGNNPLICIKEDKPVDQEATDAMVSRFNVVEMGRVLPWRKKEIVQEIIDEMLINKNINRQSDSFKKLLEAIEKCIENDEEDGVRGVQRKVAALVNEFLFTREFGDDWSFLKPKNSEEVVVVSVE